MFSLRNLIQEGLNSMVTLQPEPRNEIWASDLGKSYIDRYMSMKGVPYSNPSDGFSMQHFFIGIGVERAFLQQVELCMMPTVESKKIRIEKDGCLPVVGRADLLFEVPNWDEVEQRIDDYVQKTELASDLQIRKKLQLREVVQHWRKKFPSGIPKSVYEIKSINSWALKYNKTDEALLNAYPHYLMQLTAYMLGHNLTEGGLIFIAKDAGKNYGFIREIPVYLSDKLVKMFWQDVEEFSDYFLNNKVPPKEPLVVNGKLNWRVRYSSYHDKIYKNDIEQLRHSNPELFKK